MKDVIIYCLYYLQFHRIFQLLNRNKTIILMYHGFTDREYHEGIENYQGKHINNELFRKQIIYLKKKYNIISLDYFIDCCTNGVRVPKKSIIITIDDGYKSNYTIAFPIFKEFDVPASIFLTTDFVDNRNFLWVDRLEYAINHTEAKELQLRLGEDELNFPLTTTSQKILCDKSLRKRLKFCDHEYIENTISETEVKLNVKLSEATNVPEIYEPLEWSEIVEMTKTSKVNIGSHTHKHLILAGYDNEAIKNELTVSKKIIERKTGINTRLFCYPNGAVGDFNDQSKRIIEESGYSCALTTVKGTNNELADLYELTRLAVNTKPLISFIVDICGVKFYLPI